MWRHPLCVACWDVWEMLLKRTIHISINHVSTHLRQIQPGRVQLLCSSLKPGALYNDFFLKWPHSHARANTHARTHASSDADGRWYYQERRSSSAETAQISHPGVVFECTWAAPMCVCVCLCVCVCVCVRVSQAPWESSSRGGGAGGGGHHTGHQPSLQPTHGPPASDYLPNTHRWKMNSWDCFLDFFRLLAVWLEDLRRVHQFLQIFFIFFRSEGVI